MGCGNSSAIEPEQNSKNTKSLIKGFNRKLEYYLKQIEKQSMAPTEDPQNFLAYFLNNELLFSYISNDKEECSKQYSLIENGTYKLLDCLPLYIKSNFIYAFSISKILALFSLVLFAFYSNKDKDRQLKKEEKQNLIKKIEMIEQCLKIERKQNPLSNNLEFYLFFVKSALIVTPTDSKEGEEILKQFGTGLLKSGLTFTLNNDLLESLEKGVIYIFQEYKLSRFRRKYKIMFYINQVKISFLNQLEESNNQTTIYQLMEPLQKLYLKVIKQSQDWEIWCCWIYTISDIISYKPKVKIADLGKYQLQELSEDEKDLIHKINDEEFVFEINWKIASTNEKIKNILSSHLLYHFQTPLLIGYQQLEGFEQIYLQKITQNRKNNSNQFDDQFIIKNINFLTHIRGLQQDFLKLTKKEQFTQEKLQEQVDIVSDLITKISQLELQLKQFIIWENTITSDFDVHLLIEPQINELINSFAVDCDQFKSQLSQNQFNNLFETQIQNLWSILEKHEEYKNEQDQQIENLKAKSDKIRKEAKFIELNQDQLKQKIALVIKIIFCSISFLRMNIFILFQRQIKLKKSQHSKNFQSNQESQNILTLYDYQSIIDSLQVIYQLVQQITSSENKKIQSNRISSKLEIVISHKLSIFDCQYSQLIEIMQYDQTDIIIQKVVHELCVAACKNIEQYLKSLMDGLKMIEELLEFEKKMEKEKKSSGLNDLVDEQKLKDLSELLKKLSEQHSQEIEQKFKNFFDYVKRFNQALNLQNSNVNKDKINEKFQKLQNIQKFLQTLLGMNLNQERNQRIISDIVCEVDNQINDAQEIKLIIDTNLEYTNFETEIDYFQKLKKETIQRQKVIQQTIERLNNNLISLTNLLTEEKEIYNIEQLTESLSKEKIKKYQSDLQDSIKQQLKKNQISQITIAFDPSEMRDDKVSNYPKELESDIYFILGQIGSQEESQEQQNFYDKYKEKIMDIIDEHQWKIRQTIVYQLIQIQDRCLKEESYKIVSGLLVKLSILETDNRIRQLFNDQQIVKDMAKLTEQYWPTQEESIQRIIQQKIKELDALCMEISSESQSERKKALIKQFNKEQDEINNQIKNIESLSSSLGITVLFLQDLKNNLLRIESKLKELQDSVNEIGQNIKYLMGRPFIDLFEIRMKKVLEQAQIINAEKVYVPIKTHEKFFDEGIEAKETTLFTPQIIGEGEINEFLWQQEKNSLLIHGIAGSGKSTAARKVEEFLWDLYQKTKMNTELIPNLPIFISLPQLKDPLYSAVEETLKSDNYRFNERHIEELKEAVEQGKYRIIIIMDSYDELKQQHIESNLNISNKLSKWKSKKDTKVYPKIITTSRTELLTVNDYHTWFMPESNDIKYFKEIRLVKFNDQQIQEYLNQYYELSKKKIIREYSDNQDIIEFEKIWKYEKQSLQIEKIVKKESIYLVKQLLNELWTPEQYQDKIQAMKLEPLVETAFMLEIIVVVLPQIIAQQKNKGLIKNQFVEKYSQNEAESLQLWNTLNDSKYDTFWQQYLGAFTEQEMELVITKYFKDNKQFINQFKDHIDFKQLTSALLQQPLTSYDFYLKFFQHYFDREIKKLRNKGEHINLKELWQFTQTLAVTMTFNNISSVTYEQTSILFKKEEEDWKDEYFNNNGKKGLIRSQLRKCMPLNQKNNTYAFNHKSLQEFLVAKWFIENLSQIDKETKFNSVNWQNDFLQGSVKFISDKLKSDRNEQEFLFKIITKSQDKTPTSIRSASNSIHLLNQMKYVFQNKDLSNIVLENVDLSGINFYKANLSNSNFKNVNISYCNFSNANLTAVNWEQTKLNEMAKLYAQEVESLKFLDENTLMVQHFNKLKFYNPNNHFEEINKYHLESVSDYTYFLDLLILKQKGNEGLAIICTNYVIYIVNYIYDKIIDEIKVEYKIIKLVILDDEENLLIILAKSNKLYLVTINITEHLLNAKQLKQGQNESEILNINDQNKKIKNEDMQIIDEVKKGQREFHQYFFGDSYFYDKKLKKIDFKIDFDKYQCCDALDPVIVLANQDHQIHVFHTSNCTTFKKLEGHQSYITDLLIIKNGDKLLSCDLYNNIISWDLLKFIKLNQLEFSKISLIAIHNNSSKLCIYQEYYLEIWDIDQSSSKSAVLSSDDVCCCALSFNELYVITESRRQSSIKIWDLQKGKQFGNSIFVDEIFYLQFSVDSLSFYGSTYDGYIYQWELATQKQLTKLNNFYDPVTQIYPIDKNIILTIQIDKLVKLWNLQNNTFKLIYNHEENETVEEFQNQNSVEYYKQSQQYPLSFDIYNTYQSIIGIQRSKIEVQLHYRNLTLLHSNNFIGKFSRQTNGKIEKLIVQNYSACFLNYCNIKLLAFNPKKNKTYEYEIMCNFEIQDMICYQEQIIYLMKNQNNNDNNSEIEQIIEFRKLDNLDLPLPPISIPQKEEINCFDINQDILYFGGMEGSLSAFDIRLDKIIYSFKRHQSQITQIKYLSNYKAVLTVSEDANIILSGLDKIMDQTKEKDDKPILFLSVSNDQNQIMIGTSNSLSLYFIQNQQLQFEESFDQFADIKSLYVDFDNMDVLMTYDGGSQKIKIHLSLKRIIKSLQNKFKHKPSQICYNDGQIFIADDYGGINCWDINGQKKSEIQEQNIKKEKIIQFQIYHNQILKVTEREIKIYDLLDKCKLLSQISNASFISVHLSCDQLLQIKKDQIYLNDETYMRYQKNDIQASDLKGNLLAIYNNNSLFKIYNIEKLTLQYNFSPTQELYCDNANIQDATIKDQQGMDIKPIFIQKNIQQVPKKISF